MKKKRTIWQEMWKARYLYLLLLPLLVWLAVFAYAPMGGLILAFKNYKANLGIFGSEWVGLANFRRMFLTPEATKVIINTLEISFGRLLFEFPAPIILAILITEMPGVKVKKVYQTILTFPHFLSWVVAAVILKNFLGHDGAINALLVSLGFERIEFLSESALFRPILYLTSNWKEMGWSAIIYMAAIAGIDPTLYEAASIDGAGRLRQIWHITLSGIKTTIVVMFILKVGGLMNAGFDQIFNLQSLTVRDVADILDTYIYRITFENLPSYGFSTAVGMFKSVINFGLLLGANYLAGKFGEQKMIG